MPEPNPSGEEDKKLEIECPRCGNSVTVRDYQQNIVVCGECGLVLKEDIKDGGPEWTAYSAEGYKEKSRAGPPSTEAIHDRGLSTQIDYGGRDAKGKRLSPEQKRQVYRLRKWHKRAKISGSKDRTLAFGFSEMNRMVSQLGLSKSVQEMASKIYREAVEDDLVRGRSIEGVASAVLYMACRKAQVPRTLEEVAEASRVDRKEIGKTYRFILRELDIDLPLTDPARYVARFGSELGFSGEVRVEAMKIIRKAQEEKLTSGRSPAGIAAAAIYIAALKCGEGVTQEEVAKVADVTDVTVRNRYKELVEELGEDVEV